MSTRSRSFIKPQGSGGWALDCEPNGMLVYDLLNSCTDADAGSHGALPTLRVERVKQVHHKCQNPVALLCGLGGVYYPGSSLTCLYANTAALDLHQCPDTDSFQHQLEHMLKHQSATAAMLQALIKRIPTGVAAATSRFIPKVQQTKTGLSDPFLLLEAAPCFVINQADACQDLQPALLLHFQRVTPGNQAALLTQLTWECTALNSQVPSLVTVITLDGQVRYQNTKSLATLGMAQGQSSQKVSVSDPAHPLSKLFIWERDLLDDMWDSLEMGQAWQGRMRMPRSISLVPVLQPSKSSCKLQTVWDETQAPVTITKKKSKTAPALLSKLASLLRWKSKSPSVLSDSESDRASGSSQAPTMSSKAEQELALSTPLTPRSHGHRTLNLLDSFPEDVHQSEPGMSPRDPAINPFTNLKSRMSGTYDGVPSNPSAPGWQPLVKLPSVGGVGVSGFSNPLTKSFSLSRRGPQSQGGLEFTAANRCMKMINSRRTSMAIEAESDNIMETGLMMGSSKSIDVVAQVDELWFDVEASRFPDPTTGEEIILLVQTDVTATVQAEQDTQNILDAEHGLLEQVFPKHVLEVLAIDRAEQKRVGMSSAMISPTNVDALARSHKSVTLMFADIVTYTNMCHETDARTVMAFLNRLFSQLDDLSEKHQVYKVETVGDCYIVAAGLVREDEEEGCRTVDESYVDPDAGRKVLAFARDMLKIASRVCLPTTGEPVKIRVGIHTGPVVSGVIGKRMPRFGVFGDTVNTASRMEANSQPGRIHVSDAAKQAIGDAPPGGVWVPTGGIQVKGKGLMETFFFSEQDAGDWRVQSCRTPWGLR